jgi:hypothetical protein
VIKPIRPDEVVGAKEGAIPDIVFKVVNALIAEKFSSGHAVIRQSDIVARLRDEGLTTPVIFDRNYLDIEDVYRGAGWVVVYDKPAYNETYEATFTFTPSSENLWTKKSSRH